MRSIAGLIVCTLFLVLQLPAQRVRYAGIKGTVADSSSRQPVEAATVSVFLLSDSSLINYGITNKKGEFHVSQVPIDKPCGLMVSYSGYNNHSQRFSLPADTKEFSFPAILITKTFREMEEVIVSAQRPPVMIKKDTVEFNAGSFKTPVNGVVEDLLKQLPGIEVDADGNITINGKKVSKITVDGKDFFGGDLKITSKNLPRDIIDKVQVVDNKTREARFNKTATGNEDKAINLTLKKGKDKGIFGRTSAGYGSDKRYETGSNLNYFSQKLQLNFIGYANNTNRMNFSGGDFSMSRGGSTLSGGGAGIAENKAAGLNFSSEVSSRLKLNGSYFYNNSKTTNQTNSQRQNILPDTSFLYNSSSQNINKNDGHRLNLNFEYKPDTTIDLFVNTFLSLSNNDYINQNNALSTSLLKTPINASNNIFAGTADDQNPGIEVFFGHRLHKQGRSFTLNMNYNYNDHSAFDNNKGDNRFYKSDGTFDADTLDQQSLSGSKNDMLSLSASWSEPLSTKLSTIFRYNYNANISSSDKDTYRYNPATGLHDIRDTLFSNEFRNTSLAHSPNLSFAYINNAFNMTLGAGLQWLRQENIAEDIKDRFIQHYTNIFPTANIGYRFSKTGNINFNYNGRSQQPSIQQLQPVPDNTNTLYIRLGNPDLKPSFFHNVNINLQQYDSKTYWNASLGFGTIVNQIIDETWFDSLQVSRPINTNGNYNFNYNVGYSRGWKKPGWSLRLNLSANGNFIRNVSFTNHVENISNGYTFSQRIGLTYMYKELITLMPTFIIRYNNTRYSASQVQQAKYVAKNFTLNAFVNWPKRLILENNLQYNYNSRTGPGFPKGVTLWNVAVNYQLFKNRQGILRLTIYDLLKQNTSIYRMSTPTFIEDVQMQVLRQYGLLSFIYNLKQLGK